MQTTAERQVPTHAVRAELLFAARDGEAPTVIIPKGSEESARRGGLEHHRVLIADGRPRAGTFSVDCEGFQYMNIPPALTDFSDDAEIERTYYPQIKQIVADAVGADEVEIFDHTIRVTDPQTAYRRPASHAHNDYTVNSGPSRLADMIGEARAQEWLKDRLVQINVWRPIAEPVLETPLAFLDSTSIAEGDLVETAIINERQNGRVGQIYSVRHDPRQRWYYFPNMTMNEAVLIKGYDSATDGRARFTPHSAFADPTTPDDAPPRRSIEVRTFARVPQ